jgi:hypothetical protein
MSDLHPHRLRHTLGTLVRQHIEVALMADAESQLG